MLNFQLSILVLFLCVTIWPFFMTRDAVCFILFLFCFVRPDKTFFRQDFAVTKIIKWKKHLPVKTSKFTTQVIHRIWLRVLWLMCNTSELTGDEKKQKHSEYLDPTSTQFFFQKLPYILHPLNELDRKMKVYSIYDIHDHRVCRRLNTRRHSALMSDHEWLIRRELKIKFLLLWQVAWNASICMEPVLQNKSIRYFQRCQTSKRWVYFIKREQRAQKT